MAKVGIIRVSNSNPLVGDKLLSELRAWLRGTGWDNVVSVTSQVVREGTFVDFIPGEFQSNAPKRIWLKGGANLSEFENLLAHWLWELE
ncbi:MAG: hypothetical protein JSU04_15235 [Bdellovibrionales bacterium]|nr:hypothetical protein [Bdellovibrionales bacterium]